MPRYFPICDKFIILLDSVISKLISLNVLSRDEEGKIISFQLIVIICKQIETQNVEKVSIENYLLSYN